MARTKPPLKLRRGTQAEILAAFAASSADFAVGEPVFATDTGKLYVKDAAGSLQEISGSGGPGGAVSSVNGLTGAVVIDKSSVGLGNVQNVDTTNAANVSSGTFDGARIPNLDASKITSGTLNADQIPTLAQSKITNLTTDLGNRALSSRNISTGTGLTGGGNLTADRTLAVDFASSGTSSNTQAVRADDSRLSNSRTPTSHTHGSITNDGKIGSASGLPVVTTTAGALTTLALGSPGQVLKVDPSGTFVEWAADQTGMTSGDADVASDPIWNAKGDLAVGIADDQATRLAAGSNGQVLAVDTSVTATNLAWKTLAKGDVGLGNVDNTSDASKPISTATQTALDGKAAASHTHPASQIADFADAVEARLLVELPTNAGVLDLAQESTLQQLFGRTITTGDGLTGGGDLTTNRTLSVDLATNSGLEIDSAKLRAKVKSNGGIVRDADGLSVSLPNSSVATAAVADGAITMAKIAQSGATTNQVIKWNGTAWSPADDVVGSGSEGGAPTDAEYLTKSSNGGLSAERVVGDSTSVTANWATSGQVSFERAALTGDVTASANSNSTTIADQAVTLAKIQHVESDSILGNPKSTAGAVEVITCTAAGRAILDDVDAAAQRTTLGAAAENHAHAWGDITSGVPSTFAPSAHASSHATGGADAIAPADIGAAAASHTHGSVTNDGKVGSTAGLVLKTGTDGVIETLALGTAGQVLKVNSGATGIEWGTDATSSGSGDIATDTIWSAKGEIVAATGNDAAVAVTVGTNGQALVADSTAQAGLAWKTLAAADVGAAATSHTHALADLTQSGATENQVVTWNGTAWVPATPSGSGPGGGAPAQTQKYVNLEHFEFAITTPREMVLAVSNGSVGGSFEIGRVGVVNITTGSVAVANSVAAWRLQNSSTPHDFSAVSAATYSTLIKGMNLGDSTTTGFVFCGIARLSAPPGSDPTNGVYFRATDGGNWYAVTRASNTETATDTGVSQSTSLWRRLTAKYTASSCTFYVDGSLVATHTTNIPTAELNYGMSVVKTAAVTGQIRYQVDYLYIEHTYANAVVVD